MYCKKCGNEIKENEKFCGKCGAKISNVTNMNTSKKPIKIKFTYLLIGIIVLLLFIAIIIGSDSIIGKANDVIHSNKTGINSKVTSNTNWSTEIDSQKVFNINYDEFMNKCKDKLKILSDMSVEVTRNGTLYGGEVSYPKDWLIVKNEKFTNYVDGELTFKEIFIGRVIFIEEYQGKVKSITYLKETNSLPDTIAEQTIAELLEEYEIDINELNKEVTDIEKAVVGVGKYEAGITYARLNADPSYVAKIYRSKGYFGNLPYEYKNKDNGKYTILNVK